MVRTTAQVENENPGKLTAQKKPASKYIRRESFIARGKASIMFHMVIVLSLFIRRQKDEQGKEKTIRYH